MDATLTTHALTGDSIRAHFDDIARLRITVFCEWPYLYEGSLAYERNYLAHYANCADGVLVIARTDEGTSQLP